MVEDRDQQIIIAQSGKKAVYVTVEEFNSIVQPYSDQCMGNNPSLLEPMWVDIQYPSYDLMHSLMVLFGIHSLTVEDCLMDTEKAQQKVEMFDSYRFVAFSEHRVIPYTNIWTSVDVQLIMPTGAPLVLALHNGPVAYICAILNRIQALTPPKGGTPLNASRSDKTSSVVNPSPTSSQLLRSKRVEKRVAGKCSIPTPEWLMYAILDNIVDQFLGLVYECAVEVERLDGLVFMLPAREQSDFLRRIGVVRSRISVLRLQLVRKQDVVKELLSIAHGRDNPPFGPIPPHNRRMASIKVFLRDILDHVVAMLIDLEQDKDTLQSIASSFISKVSIEMSIQDTEQNIIMKKFSAMATIVLPLTFVTALFGMNVEVPWKGASSTWAWGTITGALVGVGILASIVFWWIDWF
jgi:magnesium transporter